MRVYRLAHFLALALGALVFLEGPALSQPAQCGRTAPGASAAATTLVITGQAGGQIHLCGWDVTATAASTFQIVTGTGATCGTNTVNITAAHAMTGQNTINTSAATPGRFSAPVGNSICVIVTGTGPVQWTIYYALFF
jgi:hypothetical protein